MISLKKLKMKKIQLFSSKEEVEKAFASLEQKTRDKFSELAKARRKSYHESSKIVLD